MAVCRYHPERPGIGVCMRCRSVICTDCCTRVDGVNHCHACLKALARPTEKPAGNPFSAGVTALMALGASALIFFGIGLLLQGRIAP